MVGRTFTHTSVGLSHLLQWIKSSKSVYIDPSSAQLLWKLHPLALPKVELEDMDVVQHRQPLKVSWDLESKGQHLWGFSLFEYCCCCVSFIAVAALQCSVIQLKNSFHNHWCWELVIKENSAFFSSIKKESHIRQKPSLIKGKCIFNITINHWLLIGKSCLMRYFWNASSNTEEFMFRGT